MTKSQANTKQHPEAELLLQKITHILHPRCRPKIIGYILKNKRNNKCVRIHEIIRLTMMKMKIEMKKNRSHRYGINRSRPRHGQKYSQCKNCLSMKMLICIKQHLSKI